MCGADVFAFVVVVLLFVLCSRCAANSDEAVVRFAAGECNDSEGDESPPEAFAAFMVGARR